MKMNKKVLSAFCVLAPIVASNYATADEAVIKAVGFDYRHEYRVHDRTHYDKLTFAAQLPRDFMFAVETKFKTGGSTPKDKVYRDTVLNAVEMTLAKKYTFDDLSVSLLFQPEFNSTRTEWKVGVSPWYKFNDRWSLGGLYRLEVMDFAHDTSGCANCSTNKSRTSNRFDIYLRNRWGNLTTTYKYIHIFSDEVLYNNKKQNYEQELQFNYALGEKKEWSPYITFGDINTSSRSSKRQLRLRIGVGYTFK